MNIKSQLIEVTDNISWKQHTLVNDNGMNVSFLNYGGIITNIIVPDKQGTMENVVLGYRHSKDYLANPNYFGALIGRGAGRIQDSTFQLEGKIFKVEANDGVNHLHGGSIGFHKVIWDTTPFHAKDSIGVTLTYHSPDGEGGYPGNVGVTVTYELNNDNQFIIKYHAISDKTTAFAMTNHTYFNLTGNLKQTVQGHHIKIESSQFVELDQALIPTGTLLSVADTPFDFRNGRKLDDGMKSTHPQNTLAGNGYDHYFLFDQVNKENVVVREEKSGRKLTLTTSSPGMVMYTSNGLDENLDLIEGKSRRYLGVCFETQASPASLHHEGFPSVVVKGGETYRAWTVFSFEVE